jgi:hypothetical protein
MNPPAALRFILLASLAAPAFAQVSRAKPPAKLQPKPWLEMDYGPTLSASIESAYPARHITQKGIAIRLDAKSQTYVLFDEDLLRYSLAWTGGFIDFHGVLFDGIHRVWPSVVGQPIFGTPLAPGWAKAGSFDDPRPRFKSTDYTKESADWQNRAYGPLPHEHAQYKGLYLHNDQVILSYTIAGTPVLDSPGLEWAGPLPVITRTLNIEKSAADLDLEILEHSTKTAKIILTGASPTRARKATAAGSCAVVGELAPRSVIPSTQPMSDSAIAVLAIGAAPDMSFTLAGESHLRLHIPAAATPACIKLLHARVNPATLAVFTTVVPQKTAGPADLSTLIDGGPARYPQQLVTQGKLATATDKPLVADTLAAPTGNPFKSRMRFGAFDFFADGKSAAISTWDGDVWLVSNIDEKLDHLTWRRIATGLFQPLGLKIVTRPTPEIYVLCRDQLVRLHDLNGDGEIDFYECVNNDAQVTEHFHEFAMGLQADAQGNFYYAKSARHALDAVVPHHGTLLKISSDGAKTEILTNGFRAANGVGIGPNGEIAATDQEGFWTPANRINLITKPGGFYGNLWSYLSSPRSVKDGYDPPLCWIPVNVDRSPAEDLWVTSAQWGPLKGQMLHTSYGTGKLYLVLCETIDGIPQGGILPIPDLAFPTGVMRARFNPGDGQLYLCGLVGWATNCTEPGGFYRVRYTNKPLHLPTALHVKKDQIQISFTDPLDKSSARDIDNYSIQQWSYRWTQSYGSKHYSVIDPKKEGQDDVEITAVSLSEDARTIALTVPDLKPVMQMKIQFDLKAADGSAVKHTIHNTINRVP